MEEEEEEEEEHTRICTHTNIETNGVHGREGDIGVSIEEVGDKRREPDRRPVGHSIIAEALIEADLTGTQGSRFTGSNRCGRDAASSTIR